MRIRTLFKFLFFKFKFRKLVLLVFLFTVISISLRKKNYKLTNINIIKAYNSNYFVSNGKVLLYSSVLYTNENKIETLNYIQNFSSKHLKCVIHYQGKYFLYSIFQFLEISLMKTKYNVTSMFKVICNFEINFSRNHEISVGIIDIRDYSINGLDFKYILTQKPKIIKLDGKKKKKIVNCVHTINRLDSSKFRNLIQWITFQKKIGYNKIDLYFLNYNKNHLDILKKKFRSYINIITHDLSEKTVCGWHKKKVNYFPKDLQYIKLLEQCLSSFAIFLDTRDYYIKNSHERLNSNDCLMKNKHYYQYLSNYDFDEFIFPRSLNTDFVRSLNKSMKCGENFKMKTLSIMNYLENLERSFGLNIAFFYFKNVNMLKQHDELRKNILSNNSDLLEYSSLQTKLKFIIKNKNDRILFDSLIASIPIFNCINLTINSRITFDKKWNNYIGALVNNRPGKSIYNTDYTLSFSQHFALTTKPGSKRVNVPLNLGYVSHFRDKDLAIEKQYSIQNLFFDFEYYNNFLKNFE